MAGKKQGNHALGGDKKTRDKMNRNNPRENKRGGKKSIERGKNIKVISWAEEAAIKRTKRIIRNKKQKYHGKQIKQFKKRRKEKRRKEIK